MENFTAEDVLTWSMIAGMALAIFTLFWPEGDEGDDDAR